jgi:hypothetical protein
MTPPQPEHIRELRKRVNTLRAANDLAGLCQLAAEAKDKWLPTKSAEYYPVILELCLALNSMAPTKPEAYEAMRDLAVAAIDSPGEKPGEVTGKILLLLQGDPDYSRGQLKGEAWVKERQVRAGRWLKVWKVMREQLAAMPEPGPRYPRVSPPPETRLPEGVPPSAIKDPVLRKKYEDAIERNARNIEAYQKKRDLADFEKNFADPAKRYLIDAYSKPPFQTGELEKSLAASGLDKETCAAILKEVNKRVAEQVALAPAANTPPRMVVTEPAPPGTAPHHADPRLRAKLSLDLKAPSVDDVLQELRKGTGVALTRADGIQNQHPAVGSISVRGVPAWQVMDDLAASKRVEGRWESEGSEGAGYRLVPNGNPVTIPEAEQAAAVPPGRSPGAKLLLGLLLVLTVVSVAIWVWWNRSLRRHPPPPVVPN